MHERSSRWRPPQRRQWRVARVEGEGSLALPADLAAAHGLVAGAEADVEEMADGLLVRRPLTYLAKVYVEATNRCNLTCRTCMRNGWDEPLGLMAAGTWERVLAGVRSLPRPPLVFFGGMGEPLLHPDIGTMVEQAKACDARVELITNGTLLEPSLQAALADAGLDMLWVSLDGASAESYADVRLGAALPGVLANLEQLALRDGPGPELGISFVAMRRNVQDLPRIVQLAERLGARRLMVTNVVAHTAEMAREMLSPWALGDPPFPDALQVSLPRLDANDATWRPLYDLLRLQPSPSLGGVPLDGSRNRCPFVAAGSLAVRWDGAVSPCLPLLHEHTVFLAHHERRSRHYAAGNLADDDLPAIWTAPDYVNLRRRLQRFDFSPCTACGGCYLAESNEEDCYGNGVPACGGCPWAQGVIQCP
ncbi:MAG: radical SAM protein [Anaerolineae bacterium]